MPLKEVLSFKHQMIDNYISQLGHSYIFVGARVPAPHLCNGAQDRSCRIFQAPLKEGHLICAFLVGVQSPRPNLEFARSLSLCL